MTYPSSFSKPAFGTLALRFDISSSIGLGHFKRAEAFVHTLRKQGGVSGCGPFRGVLFVVRASDAAALEAVNTHRVPYLVFDSVSGEGAWVRARPDISHVVADICHHGNQRTTAQIDEIYCARAPENSVDITVIDSMPPLHFIEHSTRLPQRIVTPYLDAARHRPRPRCQVWLAGSDYAILDPEFTSGEGDEADLPPTDQATGQIQAGARRPLLLTTGGADGTHLAARLLQMLLETGNADTPLVIVCGKMWAEAYRAHVVELASAFSALTLMDQQTSLKSVMKRSGAVLTRPGLTRYEAARLGKTTVMVAETSDHRSYLEGFETKGLSRVFFIHETAGHARLLGFLESLAAPEVRACFYTRNRQAQELVDGKGAERFLSVLTAPLSPEFHPAPFPTT